MAKKEKILNARVDYDKTCFIVFYAGSLAFLIGTLSNEGWVRYLLGSGFISLGLAGSIFGHKYRKSYNELMEFLKK